MTTTKSKKTVMNINRKVLFFVVIFQSTIASHAQKETPEFSHTVEGTIQPWTNKPFYNNPDNFQFAIVGDNTGGHRQGVFGKGIEKINQLYPEFVMSVGDLIEGYTKDNSVIDQEWKEFDGILDSLATRFFYVAGNHDYSNDVMAKQWKERYGKSYYHFIYKNVLFLIVNSNDGDGVLLGKDQIGFLKEAIAQNTNVRWTMIFMHHPLWTYGDVNGFDAVEAALTDRDYTVFAGHTHRYLHEVRNDQNHYVLATTGGGSKLRGAKFGEFDHISWVTMTDKGPKLVNLALSGIINHDVSNPETKELAVSLIDATDFETLILAREKERKVLMVLKNTSDKTIHFKGQLYHHHQVQADSSHFQLSMPPQSTRQISFKTRPAGDLPETDWDPLELQWKMAYDGDFMEPQLSLNGTEIIELKPSSTGISMTEPNIFVKDLKVDLQHPYKNLSAKYSTDGTTPLKDAPILATQLNIEQTTNIKVRLVDSDGFQGAVYEKKYTKVKPASALKPKNKKKGLSYSYYEGNFTSVPDFKKLKPIKTGSTMVLDPDKIGQRLDYYAIQYKGFISVPKTGIYTFYLTSDDGSQLFLHDELVVDNDGSHDSTTKTGLKSLKKGFHPIRINYFEDFLEQELELEYSGPGTEKSPMNFWH